MQECDDHTGVMQAGVTATVRLLMQHGYVHVGHGALQEGGLSTCKCGAWGPAGAWPEYMHVWGMGSCRGGAWGPAGGGPEHACVRHGALQGDGLSTCMCGAWFCS